MNSIAENRKLKTVHGVHAHVDLVMNGSIECCGYNGHISRRSESYLIDITDLHAFTDVFGEMTSLFLLAHKTKRLQVR